MGFEYRYTFSRPVCVLDLFMANLHRLSCCRVFIATLHEICYVRKSIIHVARERYSRESHSYVCSPFDTRLFSCETNVKIISEPTRRFFRIIGRALRRAAYLKYLLLLVSAQSPLRPIARIVRRNEIACCRDRVPSYVSVECTALSNVWSSMRYHSREAKRSRKLPSRFDPGKLMRPEISHSVRTYGITYLTAECACLVSRCIVDSNTTSELANRVYMHLLACLWQCRTFYQSGIKFLIPLVIFFTFNNILRIYLLYKLNFNYN